MLQEDAPPGEEESEYSDSDDEDDSDDSSEDDEEDEEKEDEPLTLEWPETRRKQATYLFLLPIIFPLWVTIPDVRNQVKKHAGFWELPRKKGGWCHINKTEWNKMFPTEIQKILCGHLPGLHSVDRCLLLPYGVVGPSGQLF